MDSLRDVSRRRPQWKGARAGLRRGFLLSGVLLVACEGERVEAGPAASASGAGSAVPGQLSPELSSRVLAKVGDRVITLGDYAAALDRMDQFERLRYQTADRRKRLLDEMIDLELLAAEARRRGLDKRPETQEHVRQVLREEVLRDIRTKLPSLEDIPAAEVRAYYDAHRKDFKEPERRRVAHIVVRDRSTAAEVLALAGKADPKGWGEIVRKNATEAQKRAEAEVPLELAGDLGFVTAPTEGPSDNDRVPEPVRAAVFEIQKQGDVLPRLVEDGRRFHIVRLIAINPPRDRTFSEAERAIRVKLLRERILAAERAYEQELRKKHPVRIDEAALARVKVPASGKATPAEGKP